MVQQRPGGWDAITIRFQLRQDLDSDEEFAVCVMDFEMDYDVENLLVPLDFAIINGVTPENYANWGWFIIKWVRFFFVEFQINTHQ